MPLNKTEVTFIITILSLLLSLLSADTTVVTTINQGDESKAYNNCTFIKNYGNSDLSEKNIERLIEYLDYKDDYLL